MIATGFGKKIDHERGRNLRGVLAAVRGKKSFQRFEQIGRLMGPFQDLLNLFLVPIRHCRNNGLLILEIAIDQPDTDTGFGTNIVHAGLMKSAFRKANDGGIKDLRRPIQAGLCLGLGHGVGKMNERSFIVKCGHLGGKTRRLPVAPIFFDSTHGLKAARLLYVKQFPFCPSSR